MMDLFGSKLLMMLFQNMPLINIILQFILSNTIYNIIKISDCLRRHNIPTRKYSPSKDINLRHDIISLKKEYNMSIKDIATVVDK